MSEGLSPAFANALLNVLNGTVPTAYATVYVDLHTADPGSAGTASLSAGSTSRSSATFGAAANLSNVSTVTTTNVPQWTNGGAVNEVITDLSVWSAVSGGTFIFSARLSLSKTWSTGDILQLSSLSVAFPTAS